MALEGKLTTHHKAQVIPNSTAKQLSGEVGGWEELMEQRGGKTNCILWPHAWQKEYAYTMQQKWEVKRDLEDYSDLFSSMKNHLIKPPINFSR